MDQQQNVLDNAPTSSNPSINNGLGIGNSAKDGFASLMRTRSRGIRPGGPCYLIERAPTGISAIHDALVLEVLGDPSLAAPNGQPCVLLVTATGGQKHAGLSEWSNALDRKAHVVHTSHPDWIEGRTAFCYEEIQVPTADNIAARTAYEVNRIFCSAQFGDVYPAWEDLTDTYRQVLTAGVRRLWDDGTLTPESQHIAWMADMELKGWKYGDKYDPVALTNPSMQAWDALSRPLQAKDFLFFAVARSLGDMPIEVSEYIDGAPAPSPAQIVGQTGGDDDEELELTGAGAGAGQTTSA